MTGQGYRPIKLNLGATPPDTWRSLVIDFFHAYGHWFGRAALLALLIVGLFQVRALFHELDELRAAKAAVMAQAPALTAAIPSSGERLVWGPPMHVVIEGRPYSLRMVIEEGR